MTEEPTFEGLFRQAKHSAVHLEMRDGYMRSDSEFISWSQDPLSVPPRCAPDSRPWLSLMKEITGRGVVVRRTRIFSEPMSDYLRFEHHLTPRNVEAGEQVRWLPRRKASDLALPGNDFWLFDNSLVLFLHFTGDGELSPEGDEERTTDPSVVRLCSTAFETVWERATSHEEYRPV
ncbi:hypothetical protein FCH28_29150 [Streptomyces piniterrae]|uniref:DUF6879 domain-containing protein n=1 Tax=Streptomyces piniterrae TaxID=2571125 RepID=A0A4U0MWK9_9ACTN|nr:DUF6879 family protein [Streptomyces piniterrae]TJZ45397.1 hypothetical protein FCH28_29150 [Streptomyces piniterrae]